MSSLTFIQYLLFFFHGSIKFVKQLRVPAAPIVSIPTALDFQTGRGDGTGRKIEATANPAATSCSPQMLIPPEVRFSVPCDPAVDALAPMPIAFHIAEHERSLVIPVSRI
jgi:hypothetical protein